MELLVEIILDRNRAAKERGSLVPFAYEGLHEDLVMLERIVNAARDEVTTHRSDCECPLCESIRELYEWAGKKLPQRD